ECGSNRAPVLVGGGSKGRTMSQTALPYAPVPSAAVRAPRRSAGDADATRGGPGADPYDWSREVPEWTSDSAPTGRRETAAHGRLRRPPRNRRRCGGEPRRTRGRSLRLVSGGPGVDLRLRADRPTGDGRPRPPPAPARPRRTAPADQAGPDRPVLPARHGGRGGMRPPGGDPRDPGGLHRGRLHRELPPPAGAVPHRRRRRGGHALGDRRAGPPLRGPAQDRGRDRRAQRTDRAGPRTRPGTPAARTLKPSHPLLPAPPRTPSATLRLRAGDREWRHAGGRQSELRPGLRRRRLATTKSGVCVGETIHKLWLSGVDLGRKRIGALRS